MTFCWIILLSSAVALVQGQCYGPNLPDNERRDCHPWPSASREACEARGCVWCSSPTNGVPWCYYNDKVCPSTIPENQRSDCHPEAGATKTACLQRGCIWCDEGVSPGTPYCFRDTDVSQGGDTCPSDIAEQERVDCHPEPNANKAACLGRGCFYCETATPNVPWCFTPKQQGYRIVGNISGTLKGYSVNLQRINTPSWYGEEIEFVTVDVEFQTDDRLRIKFYDTNNARFEVPLNIESPPVSAPNPKYSVEFITMPVFGMRVRRVSDGATLFDTTIGGLRFANQYIQVATYLNSDKVYGFGEHEHHSYKHDMNYQRWSMYTRDQAVQKTDTPNLYGVHPFYMNVEANNNAHGVLFLNSNAQEVTLMPEPALTYRTIGGVLDIYMFLGPTPENVVQQYTGAVGRPVMVPYWSLGFQLCRWGYKDLNHMKAAVGRMRQYNIPHDVQYGDIDYMYGKRDFTVDPVNFAGLPQYVDQLKNEGTRFVIILDPGIKNDDTPGTLGYDVYARGNAADVWVKQEDCATPVQGEVWPGRTYYPDFFKTSTQNWWIDECVRFKSELDYSGLWIDMNEVSNFVAGQMGQGCTNNPVNEPPYKPRILNGMWDKTICPSHCHQANGGLEYNLHSLYGWSQAEPSLRAARQATGRRSVVFSRSTFPGAQSYAQHWLGDNYSRWSNLRYSIIGMMEFNLFGFPYTGADICGFLENTTEQMCQRWQQLGAFYPFSRNHNHQDNLDADPGMWSTVAQTTRETLEIRYKLLPYLYTLMYHAHVDGNTVVRPLLHEFTSDANTHDISDQFLWGPALMISPVLDTRTTVGAYFPDAVWYDYYTGMATGYRRQLINLDAPWNYIPLHLRGGYIIPTQEPANSTMFSRTNPMGLMVMFNEVGSASGDLYWDEGDSQDPIGTNEYFHATYAASSISGTLTSTVVKNGYSGINPLIFNEIEIMGLLINDVGSVTVNGRNEPGIWSYNAFTGELFIELSKASPQVPVNSAFTIAWTG